MTPTNINMSSSSASTGKGDTRALPLHSSAVAGASSASSIGDAGANVKEDSNDFACAKERFKATVSRSLRELVDRGGYSRERARDFILCSIKHPDPPPGDNEVLALMSSCRMTRDDAEIALTVGRALRRIRLGSRISVAKAIDELTASVSVEVLHRQRVKCVSDDFRSFSLSSLSEKANSSSTLTTLAFNGHLKAATKPCTTTTSTPTLSSTSHRRKRSFGIACVASEPRSVPSDPKLSPNVVNAEIAKKAAIALQDDQGILSLSRSKRVPSPDHHQQPPAKRSLIVTGGQLHAKNMR